MDGHHHHINPDGTEIRDTPHIHLYREGFDQLPWAEPIDWYAPGDPLGTLERFLDYVHARLPGGYQLDMF